MNPFSFRLRGLVFLRTPCRAFLDINPRYRDLLKRQGLNTAEDFFTLPAVIVSGHPNRNVGRVILTSTQIASEWQIPSPLPRAKTTDNGQRTTEITAFLKREHRFSWRDRIVNFWAGFGWCSRSYREATVLRAMQDAGIGCPEVLATGEDGLGRAFLLVRQVPDSMELPLLLRRQSQVDSVMRRRFAAELGEALAGLHDAGFNHPDLYSKHVLVSPQPSRITADSVHEAESYSGSETVTYRVSLLDCQRSHRFRKLTWAQRWQDLAALDATLTDDLVLPRERLWFLQSYLRASLATRPPRRFFHSALRSIRRRSFRLLRHRHVREARQPPLPADSQNLLRIQEECLCVTRRFHDALQGRIPTKLLRGKRRSFPSTIISILLGNKAGMKVTNCRYSFRGIGSTTLVQRRASQPWLWLWSKIRRRRLTSPELEQAGIIFRLERYGVRSVPVLAFGQSILLPWQVESFLLLQDRLGEGSESLHEWLPNHGHERWTAEMKQRRNIIRQAGILLRRMHDACCYLPTCLDRSLAVEWLPGEGPVLLVEIPERIRKRRKPSSTLANENLIALIRILNLAKQSKTDRLRFLLSYYGHRRLTQPAKRMIKSLER